MQKTKILAVAPYEGLADAISTIAQTRDDIKMTVQIGDLNTGKQIAMELAHNNYDVIISRGGTAELIRSTVELPVIDIPISVYDVLRTIKLAENYSGKFVIAGLTYLLLQAKPILFRHFAKHMKTAVHSHYVIWPVLKLPRHLE